MNVESTDGGSRANQAAGHRQSWSYLREFFVEIAGSLIPGFLFTVVSAVLVGCVALLAFASLHDALGADQFSADNLRIDLDPVRFELLALILVISYVIGSVFSREDIKVPDERSAKRVLRASPGDADRSAVQYDKAGNLDVQFPYLYLYEYLQSRGLSELAKLVPWQGADKATHVLRTKMYFNRLKIHIQFFIPEKCGTVIRNEAHVRMMSTTWYAARALTWVGFAVLLATMSIVAYEWLAAHPNRRISEEIGLVAGCVFLIGFMWWIQVRIERFIHYQRVREIVWVLETVLCAQQLGFVLINDLPGQKERRVQGLN